MTRRFPPAFPSVEIVEASARGVARAEPSGSGSPVMQIHHQKISVSFDYPVIFGVNLLHPEQHALRDAVARREPGRRHRLALVLERRVAELWPRLPAELASYCAAHAATLELAGEPIVVEGGEHAKGDSEGVRRLCAAFDELGLDRQACVLVIGGGALQDLAGYAIAITHRGLRNVRMPTTVLSQNDSGVGVKNGVNARGKKNFFGTFAPPYAVLDDFRFLETLPARDKVAGMAEAVKVALVKDGSFFEWLESRAEELARFEPQALAELIQRCALLHLDHIASSGDPFELGSSRPLDFGHWAAHKLEALTEYELRHGEAVAIGIALDVAYSRRTGLLSKPAAERVLALLERLALPRYHPALELRGADGAYRVLEGLAEFREHLGGELTVMMLRGLGAGCEVHEVREDEVIACIAELAQSASGPRARVAASQDREEVEAAPALEHPRPAQGWGQQ